MSQYDEFDEIYTGNLLAIIEAWDVEEKNLLSSIREINDNLVNAFNDLESYVIEFENFENFLNKLSIQTNSGITQIYSSYSNYEYQCKKYSYLSDVVDIYLNEIVKEKDILFKGFNIGDEFYWCCLSEKFGYPPDEDEEEENEDINEE
ncbi:MAG: hypothetical protein IJ437_03695 [Clostridia bacterium]|nr:hypothetical protein [Clostridia bacterium]